ncbi:MAG: response regulator [Epsilonproteobacteria bacterium]|nr:response regulator [Campylobacterota bacterium]
MKKKHHVLIVDDTKENLKIVEKILQMAGYTTECCRSGIDALRTVKKKDFDLILLDIMMPDMSGLEVCRFLKIDSKTSSIPVIFLTADTHKETITKAYKVGGSDYLKKPFYKEELLARVQTRIQLRDYEKNLEATVEQRTKEIQETQIQLMYILGGIAEGQSKETQEHVQRVSEFTYKLAILYGMSHKEASLLKNASFLHDIGKLGISSTILHKNAHLTKKEFKEMQKHAILGAQMLQHSNLPLFKAARIVAYEHHEKYDGSGYPRGLKGKEIHIYGRIVAIADVFDALAFKRSYKKQWQLEEILAYMKDMRGKHFDPELIDLFFENIDSFLKIYNIHIEKIELDKRFNQQKRKGIIEWLRQMF